MNVGVPINGLLHLIGKVYFLMGKYAEAKAEFDAVIDYAEATGTYKLEAPKDPLIKKKRKMFPKSLFGNSIAVFWMEKYEKHNQYMYCGMVMGLRFRDSNGDELESLPGNNEGTVISSWNGFGIAYTALKEMGWMVDPMNGNYEVTPAAENDLRYQQVYHLMLPYKEGIKKGDPEYITTESLAGHAMVKLLMFILISFSVEQLLMESSLNFRLLDWLIFICCVLG